MRSSILVQFSAVCLIGAIAVKQDQITQYSGSDLSFLSGEHENQVTDEKAMSAHFAGSVIPDQNQPNSEESTAA